MNSKFREMSCPSCGFTKETMLNESESTVVLVQVDDAYYGLFFERCRHLDVLIKIHYCPKCGFCLDGQRVRACLFCAGKSVKPEETWGTIVKKGSLSIGTSTRDVHKYEPTLIVESVLDDYDNGSHADITFCPFCGVRLRKKVPPVNSGENAVRPDKKRKLLDILSFMKKKGRGK